MKREPVVSIVLPTYNRAHCVGKAIDSVLAQTYRDYELLVVDGPSTDGTSEVVHRYSDSRITYLREHGASGAGAARNTGIRAAKGQYIAFQDSDNIWLPNKLQRQMEVLTTASPLVGLVYTGYAKYADGIFKGYYPQAHIRKRSGDIHDTLLEESFIGCQTVVLRRVCLDAVGMFDERLVTTEDWELFLRITGRYHAACIDEPLVVSHLQLDSISMDTTKMIGAFRAILQSHFDEFARDRRLLAKYYFNNIATLLCEHGDVAQGRVFLVKALLLDPAKITYLLTYGASSLGNAAYGKLLRMVRAMRRRRWLPRELGSAPHGFPGIGWLRTNVRHVHDLIRTCRRGYPPATIKFFLVQLLVSAVVYPVAAVMGSTRARRVSKQVGEALLPANVTLPLPSPLKGRVRTRERGSGYANIYYDDEYHRAYIGKGMIVVDVGAYIGLYTCMAAEMVGSTGRVIAFEPDPANRRQLLDNVALNEFGNVTVVGSALSDKAGSGELYLKHHGTVSSLIGNGDCVRVEIDTLDISLERIGARRVDIIKIDVEGHELPVLRGAVKTIRSNPGVKFVIASYHYPEQVRDVGCFLAEMGFATAVTPQGILFADRGLR